MDSEIREILVGMKAILSEGWIQGDLETEEGVCVYGALARAAKLPAGYGVCGPDVVKGRDHGQDIGPMYMIPNDSKAMQAITVLAAQIGVSDIKLLALWNDEAGRSINEITNAIDHILLRDCAPKKNTFKRISHKDKEMAAL